MLRLRLLLAWALPFTGCSLLFPLGEFSSERGASPTPVPVDASEAETIDGASDAASPCGSPLGCGSVVGLSVGFNFSCALLRGGEVRCWGNDKGRQLGRPAAARAGCKTPSGYETLEPCSWEPAPVEGLTGAIQIATGMYTACALVDGGEVRCWGQNAFGELGVPPGELPDRCPYACSSSPVRVRGLPADDPVVQVAVGASGGDTDAACARTRDGRIYCWGGNPSLGQVDAGGAHMPQLVIGTGAQDVAMPLDYLPRNSYCAATEGGVFCWGDLVDRIVQADAGLPPSLVAPLGRSVQVGETVACASDPTGAISCWGTNKRAEFGVRPAPIVSFAPRSVHEGFSATALSFRNGHLLAIDNQGALSGWGGNGQGQIARDPDASAACGPFVCEPNRVAIALPGRVVLVAAGLGHSLAKTEDGRVWAWGYNQFGELGHEPASGDSFCRQPTGAGQGPCRFTPTEIVGLR